ncbi:carnitine dehydratase [Rathayibacter sp. Leaf185]|nr:carnitine dehydratase [Rathayibacter sp. Leaf294]KQS11316.1 carnitine dehydratase [Rathayibacter sp. Leaf185]
MTNSTAPDTTLFEQLTGGPLEGLVVADFGRVLAGPYCTMLLADLGATVIKVESPRGDETRSWAPPRHEDESTYYLSINRNKHSVVLDFTDPDDLDLAQRLAARADIVAENFKPSGLARFGLDYESVRAENPEVIYASVSGFGTAGGASLPGYDLLVQAASGLISLTGPPETEGYRSGIALFDVITGLHTAVGILAALRHRDRTGEGQHLELNLMMSALSGMVNQTGGYVLNGEVPGRLGNDHPSIYPYAPFPTADGDIVLAIGNDVQFAALCSALGLGDVASDARFATNVARSEHRSLLRPLIVDSLRSRSAEKWFDLMSARGIPCAPILDVGAGMAFAERIGLAPIIEAGTGDRRMRGVRNPISFSRSPVRYDLAPPVLDGSGDVVRAWLSADADAFAAGDAAHATSAAQ